MRHVTNILPIAKPNAIGQVVEHHAVAIAIIAHVGRQQRRVTTTHQSLRAAPRLPPGDRQLQLLALHHLGWDDHTIAELREKGQESVCAGRVAQQGAVGELHAASIDRAAHERVSQRIAPPLAAAGGCCRGCLPRCLPMRLMRRCNKADQRHGQCRKHRPRGPLWVRCHVRIFMATGNVAGMKRARTSTHPPSGGTPIAPAGSPTVYTLPQPSATACDGCRVGTKVLILSRASRGDPYSARYPSDFSPERRASYASPGYG